MLSSADIGMIRERISSCEHDYFVWCSLLGEPYLIDGFLCYFDGESVAVSGVPVLDVGAPRTQSTRLVELIERWMDEPAVTFVNYFGPHQLPDPREDEFELICAEEPEEHNVDLFVDFRAPRSACELRRVRQDVQRALRRGIEIEAKRQDCLTHDQIRLISRLAKRSDLGISDVMYLTNLGAFVRNDATKVFEARIGGHVVGFGVAHNHFVGKIFLVAAAFDYRVPGASDAIYSAVLSHYQSRGALWIGLGYAATPGQLRYKLKWGGSAATPPCWQFIWRRHRTESVFRESLHWPWRLASDKWASY
jgi:hypothetical protein